MNKKAYHNGIHERLSCFKGNIGVVRVVPHIQFDDGMVDLQTESKKVDYTHKSGLLGRGSPNQK